MRRVKRTVIFTCIFVMYSPIFLAQQDANTWRLGIGVNYLINPDIVDQFNDAPESVFDGFEYDELNYEFYVEKLLSESWGTHLKFESTSSLKTVQELSLSQAYYTDNRYLLGRRAFIAPYFSLGIGGDFVNNELIIPASVGLKLRFNRSVNLNLEYLAKTYPAAWKQDHGKFDTGILNSLAISVHYNFHKRKRTFVAPPIYSSKEYDYEQEIVLPIITDTVAVLHFINDNLEVLELSENMDPKLTSIDTIVTHEYDTLATLVDIDESIFLVLDSTKYHYALSDSLIQEHVEDTLDVLKYDTLLSYLFTHEEEEYDFDSLAITRNNTILDSVRLLSDSVIFDVSLTQKDHTDTVLTFIGVSDDLSVDSARVDTLMVAYSLENRMLNQPVYLSDSIATIVSHEGGDTLFKVIHFKWDTLVIPVKYDQQNTVYENEEASTLYTEEDLVRFLRKAREPEANAEDRFNPIPSEKGEALVTKKTIQHSTPRVMVGKEYVDDSAQRIASSNISHGLNDLYEKLDSLTSYLLLERQITHEQRDINSGNMSVEQIHNLRNEIDVLKQNEEQSQLRAKILYERIKELEAVNAYLLKGMNDSLPPVLDSSTFLSSKLAPDTNVIRHVYLGDSTSLTLLEEQMMELRHTLNLMEEKELSQQQQEIPFTNSYEEFVELRNDVKALRLQVSLNEKRTKPTISSFDTQYENWEITELFFAVNSSVISAEGMAKLNRLSLFLGKYNRVLVVLRGYTDKSGSPDYNILLSKKRTEEVAAQLIHNGVDSARIKMEFRGVDKELTGEHQSYGRRVEIRLKKQEQ